MQEEQKLQMRTVGRKGQTVNRLVNKQRESEPKMEMGLRDQPGGLGVALLHLSATFLLLQGLQVRHSWSRSLFN